MIGSVSNNRRAHAFAQALGAPDTPEEEQSQATDSDSARAAGTSEPGRADNDEHTMLLAVAERLGAVPGPELDPEVKTVQRAQLIAAMENQLAGEKVPEQRSRKGAHRAQSASALSRLQPKSRLSKGLAAGGLTMGVAAGALGGVAGASTDALPGDRLYGLKRGMEDLKLDMTGDDTARGKLHLDHASTRMNEARRLMERGRSGPLDQDQLTEVRKALSSMHTNAHDGRRLLSGAYTRDGDLGPLRSLSTFTDSHQEGWARLREQLPGELQDVSDEVHSVFEAINRDVSHISKLTPSQPGVGAPGSQPEPGQSPDRQNADTPPSDLAGNQDDGAGAGGADGSGEPSGDSSSPSHEEKEEDGLLGGGSGLLAPPGEDAGKETGDRDTQPSGPDITIPPLLPGGLPGLGLDSRPE